MLKKRLIGVVTVRQGWAVQSFGYQRYLPLGRPEVIIENLDRWGADEILVHCIDRSQNQSGPDFTLIKRIGDLGLSTPLIYGGGIRHLEDALQIVRLGAMNSINLALVGNAFAALIWWVIPIGAVLGAIIYVVWVSKFADKYANETNRSVTKFQSFQDTFRDDSTPNT